MIEKYTLKILDIFRPIFEAFRIDYVMMRRILQMKLRMDGRRAPTIFQQQKKTGNQFLKSLGIYVLFGLVTIPFIFIGDDYIFSMSIMFGIFMFILATTMVSDYSSVLLDVRDKVILNTKPVNTRTINVAKMVHIAIYLFLLLLALTGIPSIVILSKHGLLFFLIFIFELLLIGLFIIAITALVYIFILRFFSGEKLKDMINYVQIALSAGIFIGYQVAIRIFDIVGIDISYSFSWWHIFIPPIWFGAPFEMFVNGAYSIEFITLSVLALIIPIVSLLIYYWLMPAFEQNLEKLMEEVGNRKKERFQFTHLFARFLSRKDEQKYFRFAATMMGQEREFKLKVYPALGLTIVFPFIMIFNQLNMVSYTEVTEGNTYLMIYFCNIMIATVIHMLKFSGNHEGSWILKATVPMEDRGKYYQAAIKAFIVKLYLPIYLFVSAIFIWIFSVRIIPDLLIVFTSALLISVITFIIVDDGTFPFSQPFEAAQESGNAIQIFLLMIVIGAFALVHYLFVFVPYGIPIYFILMIITTFFVWRMAFAKKRFVT